MHHKLPYLPKGRQISYVPLQDKFMQVAKKTADDYSQDSRMPTGAIIVKNHEIIGSGANGSIWHKIGCLRKVLKCQTGKHYWLCGGCSTRYHAEAQALRSVKNKKDCKGADLYLYGHWWCCQSCWQIMIKAGIVHVYLSNGDMS